MASHNYLNAGHNNELAHALGLLVVLYLTLTSATSNFARREYRGVSRRQKTKQFSFCILTHSLSHTPSFIHASINTFPFEHSQEQIV